MTITKKNDKRLRYLKSAILGCLLIYFFVVSHKVIFKEKQWDFKTYYYAAGVYFNGGDPYDIDALSSAAGEPVRYHFVYPPYTLHFLRILLVFDYRTVYFLWFALKIIALVLLIITWRKFFLCDSRYEILLFLLCTLAFREAIIRDLYAGNITIFEQLLIWLAVYSFLKKKPIQYCVLITISALCKMTSIIFLLLPLIDKDRKSILSVMGATIIFLSINIISFINHPIFFREFIGNALFSGSIRRGNINPASFALIRDLVGYLSHSTGLNMPFLEILLYALFVVTVMIISYYLTKEYNFRKNRLSFVIVVFFLYALVLPRFLDYSFILLIIPSLYVIRNATTSNLVRAIALFFICVTFLPYQAFFVTMALLFLYLRYIRLSLQTEVLQV